VLDGWVQQQQAQAQVEFVLVQFSAAGARRSPFRRSSRGPGSFLSTLTESNQSMDYMTFKLDSGSANVQLMDFASSY
jgi:hypothetical protein